jgi:FkbM family methyltransferase
MVERGPIAVRRPFKHLVKRGLLRVFSPAELQYWQLTMSGKAEAELAVFPRLVPRGTVAIDVGANVGLYSLAFLRRGASVVAMEPQVRYRHALDALSGRFGRLTVCQAAASDASGYADLRVPVGEVDMGGFATLRSLSDSQDVQSVRTVRLDDLDVHKVSAIKIDVEGHEASVIRGALQLIITYHPFLMLEIEQRYIAEPVSDVIQLVENLGYKSFFIQSGSLHPTALFSTETHQRVGYLPYINNFIFKPS